MAKRQSGRQPAETLKEKRRRKAKEAKEAAKADKTPGQSESAPTRGDGTESLRNPESTETGPSLSLERGDLGIVSQMVKSGLFPYSAGERQEVASFFLDIMRDEDSPIRDRLRAAQGIVNSERINLQDKAARQVEFGRGADLEPPTIVVATDPDYIRWKHAEARKRLNVIQDTNAG